jgi:hypothetical protein
VESTTALTKFLGRFEKGAPNMVHVYRNLPRNKGKLVLQFDLYEIDDWEAGNVGAQYADITYLTINGVSITLGSYKNEWDEGFMEDWVGNIHYTSQSYGPPAAMGFGVELDQKHKVIVDIPYSWVRPDDSIEIGFLTSFTDSGEAAGFDNIKLYAVCDNPLLAPSAAPTKLTEKRNYTITNNYAPGFTGDPHIKGWNSEYSCNSSTVFTHFLAGNNQLTFFLAISVFSS